MKKKSRFMAVYLLLSLFIVTISAQAQDGGLQSENRKQGIFYLAPFYEYTQFKELKLISNTNHHRFYDGNFDETFTDEQIQRYNDHYGTEYRNSLIGLKVGYQILDGFGIAAYFGVNHFNFKSWVSDENTQTHSNELPELTFGITLDYQRNIFKNLNAILGFNVNYSKSGSSVVDNNSGEEVISSQLTAMFWEIDLAFVYTIGQFHPFAGAGYTEQKVNALQEESILTDDDNGNEVYNRTESDSDFKGNSFYGFAGLEYSFNKNLSMYAKSSFMNPFRANIGFRIIL